RTRRSSSTKNGLAGALRLAGAWCLIHPHLESTMEAIATFDPGKFKATTRAQWQAAAPAWHRWGPFIGEWLDDATEAMLDLAHVGAGRRVIDIAAGSGEQSLRAARRVGPGGYVLATD